MASNRPCDMPEQELIIKTANKIASAMDSGKPFYLTFKQVQKMFDSQSACAYSGQMFSSIGDITFERVNPNIGYVKGNVVLVRKHINDLKGKTIDRFIHESDLSLDAMADLFSDLARSLRKEFSAKQEAVVEKPKQISKLEERIMLEVAAANPANGAVEIPANLPEGRKQLMQIFIAAKANKEKPDETSAPRSRG